MKKMAVFALCALSLSSTAFCEIKENADQPDIEIWLGEGIGRYGDREFKILGGTQKYPSPTGAFEVEWKSRKWWSKQYDAAMPYAQFFYNGAALHEGSMNYHSHGCIHLSHDTAKWLYGITKEKKTRVAVFP